MHIHVNFCIPLYIHRCPKSVILYWYIWNNVAFSWHRYKMIKKSINGDVNVCQMLMQSIVLLRQPKYLLTVDSFDSYGQPSSSRTAATWWSVAASVGVSSSLPPPPNLMVGMTVSQMCGNSYEPSSLFITFVPCCRMEMLSRICLWVWLSSLSIVVMSPQPIMWLFWWTWSHMADLCLWSFFLPLLFG